MRSIIYESKREVRENVQTTGEGEYIQNIKSTRAVFEQGKKNIVKALDKEAKELAFNYPAEMVDDIFSRDEDFFFPDLTVTILRMGEERGRAYA